MRLTAAVDATLLDDARNLAAVLAFGVGDLKTFTPGWEDANGTPFWVASWDASDLWIAGAQSTLDCPDWDEEPYQVNMTGAERAQGEMVFWSGPGDDPDSPAPIPQATVGNLTVVAGMDGLAALAAMGLVRTETEGDI